LIADLDASEILGKSVLVGLTVLSVDGFVRDVQQWHGVVVAIDAEVVKVRCPSGEMKTLPPSLEAFELAVPGEYTLGGTGEVVSNPDLICTCTIHDPPAGGLSPYDRFFYWVVWGMASEPGIWEPWWEVGSYFPTDTPQADKLEWSRRLLRELYAGGWAHFIRLKNRSDLAGVRVEGHVLSAEEVEAAIADPRWSEHPDTFGQWIILRPTPKTIAWQATGGGVQPRAWDKSDS
jgi:hypothetical protein